jgi:hypothetical protein
MTAFSPTIVCHRRHGMILTIPKSFTSSTSKRHHMKIKPLIHLKNSAALAGVLVSVSSVLASSDYGPAIWNPPSGCTKYYTSGYGHKFHVIHDMEGYYLSSVSLLRSCSSTVSVHYAVNGKQDTSTDAAAGQITQMVLEADYAWHVGCWNRYSTGTEHEGFASNPAWYTETMYQASAGITKHVADKFGYAKDRNHIVGHNEHNNATWRSWASANLGIDPTCNTHQDPGSYWSWTHYMSLVNGAGAGPVKPGVFRSPSEWLLRSTLNTGPSDYDFGYGTSGDIPIMGDWDGNGTITVGVVRNQGGQLWWYLNNSNTGGGSDISFAYGVAGDIPVVGDWDGNGTWTPGVVRGVTWMLRNSNTSGGADITFNYGTTGDKFVVGDWDGNGTFTPGVFRGSNQWLLRNSNNGGGADISFGYGTTGDIPVVGDWDGNKTWTCGVVRGNNWLLRNSNTGGGSDISFGYGSGGDKFMVWR